MLRVLRNPRWPPNLEKLIISLVEQIQTRSWCLNLCLLGCPIYWCRQKSKRTGSHLENPTWLPKSSNFDVKSLVQGIETWSWCLDLCLWGCPIHWCWQISAMGSGHLDKTNMAATNLYFEQKITFLSDRNAILVSVPSKHHNLVTTLEKVVTQHCTTLWHNIVGMSRWKVFSTLSQLCARTLCHNDVTILWINNLKTSWHTMFLGMSSQK